jgi:hypothetical protein
MHYHNFANPPSDFVGLDDLPHREQAAQRPAAARNPEPRNARPPRRKGLQESCSPWQRVAPPLSTTPGWPKRSLRSSRRRSTHYKKGRPFKRRLEALAYDQKTLIDALNQANSNVARLLSRWTFASSSAVDADGKGNTSRPRELRFSIAAG